MTTELAFIEALRRLASHPGARGFDDDCAVVEIGGEALVLTHDMMVEGVHYLPGQDPADVAWKLVATNMSDLAARDVIQVRFENALLVSGQPVRIEPIVLQVTGRERRD